MNRRDYIRGARRVPDLDPKARHALLLVATYSNDAGLAWPSLATLAADMDCHPQTVRRALRRAEAAGLKITSIPGAECCYDVAALAAPLPPKVEGVPLPKRTPTPSKTGPYPYHASAQNRGGSMKYLEASAPRVEPDAELGRVDPIELTRLAPTLLDSLLRLGQTMAGQQRLDL